MGFLQKEEYVPVSDWGWKQKRNNEIYLRELALQKRTEKKIEPKPRRVRVRPTVCRERGNCKVCEATLGYANRSGVCASCYDKYRTVKKGPRPVCSRCGAKMQRTNKSEFCNNCTTNAMREGRPRFIYQNCACGNLLGNRNKVGKCKECLAKKAA